MFLSTLCRSTSSSNRAGRGEEGSTLIGVVGLVAVAGILVAVVTASTVQAMGQTSATRAGVQAQAAADAGVEFARALIASGSCQTEIDRDYGDIYSAAELVGLGVVAGDPYFEATVQYRQLLGLSGGWANGCPPSLLGILNLSYELRIESTGHASSPGVAGVNALDTHTVEAGFGWNLLSSPGTPSDASGGAIYIGGTASVNAFSVAAAEGVAGDIRMIDGDFGCTTNGVIEGNVLVADGNANITNTCEITGSLLVSGSVTITSDVHIHGDVLAAGGGVEMSNTTIQVGGNVYANGPAVIHGQIGGNLEATGAVNFNPAGSVGGSVRTGANISTWGYAWNVPSASATDNEKAAYYLTVTTGRVGGTISFLDSSAAGRAGPVVPPWVDFTYNPLDWTDYLIVTWLGDCQVGSWNKVLHVTYNLIKSSSIPILVDARICSNVTFNATDLSVKTDVVIINKSFTLGNGSDVRSSDGQDHKVWFLTPDGNAGAAGPNCSGGAGNFSTNGGPVVDDHIAAFIYTPCTIALNNGTQWRGQLYSQSLTVSAGDSLRYVQIGIPGLDLDTGVTLPGGGGLELGTLGDQKYYRDLSGPTVG